MAVAKAKLKNEMNLTNSFKILDVWIEMRVPHTIAGCADVEMHFVAKCQVVRQKQISQAQWNPILQLQHKKDNNETLV